VLVDSSSVMDLEVLPAHLLVLGAGYIGVEFAQLRRRLGSAVTPMDRGGAFLALKEPDIAQALLWVLREEGVDVVQGAAIRSVAGSGGHGAVATFDTPAGVREMRASHVLVATGRVPKEGLGASACPRRVLVRPRWVSSS
jgi:pyruvate/2-oxoglutarate dehydrogenase complex dihydrolipoamide dehydrogenase (E3) component